MQGLTTSRRSVSAFNLMLGRFDTGGIIEGVMQDWLVVFGAKRIHIDVPCVVVHYMNGGMVIFIIERDRTPQIRVFKWQDDPI